MINADELAALRDEQDRWMPDTCTITRPAGDHIYDSGTGTYVPSASTEVYAGACRVAPASGPSVVQFGETPLTLRRYWVTVPWDAGDIHVDDFVTVATSDDPDLDDQVLRVLDVTYSGHQTARRLLCEDDQG